MIAIVLDARADEGGEYAHRHGPKGSNPKRLPHVHVVQGEPESHQQEDGLDPDLVSTSAGQIALLQSLHHAVAQGLVEIGIPGVEARLNLPFLHSSDLQLVQEGRGDATGMVRLEKYRGILPSGQEDDVTTGMALGKVGDVNHTAVDGGPSVLGDIVRSQLVARNETISVDDLVLEGCIADRCSRRGAASWSLAHSLLAVVAVVELRHSQAHETGGLWWCVARIKSAFSSIGIHADQLELQSADILINFVCLCCTLFIALFVYSSVYRV